VRRLLLALVLGGVMATAGCASMGPGAPPAGTLEKIRTTKTIALGYRDSSVPFSYAGPTKEPMGYSVDLCTRVVEDLRRDLTLPDLQVTWVPVGVETRVRALVNGTIDLECGSTTNTLSRQERVDFSLTTFITGASLLALAGSGVSDQLGAIRIAVIPGTGTTSEQMVKSAIASMGAGADAAKLVAVKDHADGLAAVVDRRADVYATDRAILMGLVTSASNPSTVRAPRPVSLLRALRAHAEARGSRVPPRGQPLAGAALPLGTGARHLPSMVRPVGRPEPAHARHVRGRGVARVAVPQKLQPAPRM
jgi:ABC-type amino acid transport substrate-binding protein